MTDSFATNLGAGAVVTAAFGAIGQADPNWVDLRQLAAAGLLLSGLSAARAATSFRQHKVNTTEGAHLIGFLHLARLALFAVLGLRSDDNVWLLIFLAALANLVSVLLSDLYDEAGFESMSQLLLRWGESARKRFVHTGSGWVPIAAAALILVVVGLVALETLGFEVISTASVTTTTTTSTSQTQSTPPPIVTTTSTVPTTPPSTESTTTTIDPRDRSYDDLCTALFGTDGYVDPGEGFPVDGVNQRAHQESFFEQGGGLVAGCALLPALCIGTGESMLCQQTYYNAEEDVSGYLTFSPRCEEAGLVLAPLLDEFKALADADGVASACPRSVIHDGNYQLLLGRTDAHLAMRQSVGTPYAFLENDAITRWHEQAMTLGWAWPSSTDEREDGTSIFFAFDDGSPAFDVHISPPGPNAEFSFESLPSPSQLGSLAATGS